MGSSLEDNVTQRTTALKPIAAYFSTMMGAGLMARNDPDAVAAAFSELVSDGLSAFLGPLPTRLQDQEMLEFALGLMIRGLEMMPCLSQALFQWRSRTFRIIDL